MKKIHFVIILVALVLAGLVYSKVGNLDFGNQAAQGKSISVEMKTEGGKTSKSTVKEGMTALEYLKSQSKVATKGKGTNAYVISIDGVTAVDSRNEFWSFYVNGKMAEVGAGSYKLKKGDIIEWKLENY